MDSVLGRASVPALPLTVGDPGRNFNCFRPQFAHRKEFVSHLARRMHSVNISQKKSIYGVPWWLSGLKIQCCPCSGLGHCCGVGLIPGPGTSICCRRGQKIKKKKKKQEHLLSSVAEQHCHPLTRSNGGRLRTLPKHRGWGAEAGFQPGSVWLQSDAPPCCWCSV